VTFARGEGRGAARQPTLVFIHGWSAHGGFFAPQQALAPAWRVFMPTLPGHGGRPAPAPNIAALADDLARQISEAQIENPILIGWSMGAMVAFSLLERHPEFRAAGLVIEDMTAKILNEPGWTFGIRNGFARVHSDLAVQAMRQDWAAYARAAAPALFAERDKPAASLLDWAAEELQQNNVCALAEIWTSMADQDFRSLLPRLALPALVITGAQSQLYAPEVGRWMAQALPNASHAAIECAGHSPHLERPDEFNRAIEAFATAVNTRL